MKNLKLFIFSIFACTLFLSFDANAQAEVIFNSDIVFKDGQGGEFHSISSKTTLSPSGNIVKTAYFELPEGHILIPKSGKKFVAAKITGKDIDGNEVDMYDINIGIDKRGKFKITYHSNGAGTIFPQKYKGILD